MGDYKPYQSVVVPQKCTAHRTDGESCKAYALHGQKVCKYHGGGTAAAREAGYHNKTLQHAAELVNTYGGPVEDAHPTELLLEEIRRTAGHIRWLEERLLTDAPESLAESFWLWKRTTEVSGSREAPELLKSYGGVWLDLYMKERVHLINATSRALQLGIEERRVQLAERYVDQVADALEAFARALGHDPADPAVRAHASKALTAAAGRTTVEVIANE